MSYGTRNFKNCLGVFQGGGCKALAYIGAYEEAISRGVFFSEVAGTSAGSIIASLIAGGASPNMLRDLIADTNFNEFKVPAKNEDRRSKYLSLNVLSWFNPIPKAFVNLGFYSSEGIERWINTALWKILDLPNAEPVKFRQLKIPLSVVAAEVGNNQPVIWSTQTTPDVSVAYAVRCSCSIPGFFQAVDGRYVDGGIVSNLPTFIFKSREDAEYERILSFCFKPTTSIHATGIREARTDPKSYSLRLISSIIDGASSVQTNLQDGIHQIEIENLPFGTTDFNLIDQTTLPLAFEQGKLAARDFFEKESLHVRPNAHVRRALHSETQALNEIARYESRTGDDIYIFADSNKMAYSLFPTFLAWNQHGANLRFVTPGPRKIKTPNHDGLRDLILQGLGAEIGLLKELPFEGIHVIRDGSPYLTIATTSEDRSPGGTWRGVTYDRVYDDSLMRLLSKSLANGTGAKILSLGHLTKAQIRRGNNSDLLSRMRDVEQYADSNIKISLENIDLRRIRFLTRYVKAYKYSQIGALFQAADASGFELTDDLWVDYQMSNSTGFTMPITPPVLERHGNDLYLIEGNTRTIYMLREQKINFAKAVVVSNVSAALPSKQHFSSDMVVISDRDKTGESRYEGFNYQAYRNIELAMRHPRHYLSDSEQ